MRPCLALAVKLDTKAWSSKIAVPIVTAACEAPWSLLYRVSFARYAIRYFMMLDRDLTGLLCRLDEAVGSG